VAAGGGVGRRYYFVPRGIFSCHFHFIAEYSSRHFRSYYRRIIATHSAAAAAA
jgi:hypothetical protein